MISNYITFRELFTWFVVTCFFFVANDREPPSQPTFTRNNKVENVFILSVSLLRLIHYYHIYHIIVWCYLQFFIHFGCYSWEIWKFLYFLCFTSNHMLRKRPPESATICLQDLENNNKHKYARQLALEPPGPTQRGFFQRLFFTPANPQLSKNLAQWEIQCITGSWVLSQCERSLLGWSRPGEDNTGGYKCTMWVSIDP